KTSDIKIKKAGDTREVNAKSIMAVMSLGVKKGNEVIITAEGEDEEDAIAEIQKVLEENL
ncbi:MAG: HPr family phosphocarrier protein, partial [Coprococcus comes]|nr:HPr family phosphocarrier protein [Coprococcus comes]